LAISARCITKKSSTFSTLASATMVQNGSPLTSVSRAHRFMPRPTIASSSSATPSRMLHSGDRGRCHADKSFELV
jgi:hypothetical protein